MNNSHSSQGLKIMVMKELQIYQDELGHVSRNIGVRCKSA